jgi:hypothetical protein
VRSESPLFQEGPVAVQGDIRLRQRFYTQHAGLGRLAGTTLSVMFEIDRLAKDVWPFLQDFNLWQNPYGYYYSGVVGELEGETFALGSKEDLGAHRYRVDKVIAEHLIVISQPVLEERSTGGVSPGFHVFMLNQHEQKTLVTIIMEHASPNSDHPEEDPLAHWKGAAKKVQQMWRDSFIPTLKNLVYTGRPAYKAPNS